MQHTLCDFLTLSGLFTPIIETTTGVKTDSERMTETGTGDTVMAAQGLTMTETTAQMNMKTEEEMTTDTDLIIVETEITFVMIVET